MKSLSSTLIISILLLFTFAACEDLALSDEVDYPTTFKKISIAELETLNQEFQSQNGNNLCSTLNEYGFTGFSRVLFPNDRNPCLDREIQRTQFNFSTLLIDQSIDFIIKNSDYTGVNNAAELELIDILALRGCTICEGPDINSVPLEWKFTFANQKKAGIEVENTEITIFVDANGINSVWGNWYNFNQPNFIEVGFIQAKKNLIGEVIFRDDSSEVLITEAMLEQDAELSFLPFEIDERLEILKTWVLPIYDFNSQSIMWKGYVDVNTGNLLQVKPLFKEDTVLFQF